MHNNDFIVVQKFIEEVNNTNSTNEKIAILSKPEYKNNEFLVKVLKYTYNGFKKYYIKPKNLKKNSNLIAHTFNFKSLFDLLNTLDSRELSGHEAISQVNAFIETHSSYKEIIYNIFDRNLKIRMTTSLVNRVFPDLIKTFDVALAGKYEGRTAEKVDFNEDTWYASRKLDGIRCITMIDEVGNIKFLSRAGNEIETLNVLKEEIKKLKLKEIIFDGELCLVDEKGNEDFQGVMKQLKRKNHTIPNPKYYIFDFLSLEEFSNKESNDLLSERFQCLDNLFNNYNGNMLIKTLQTIVKDKEHLSELNAEATKKGWEGVMIRKDIPYEGKRSNNLLKCKKFHDDEYIINECHNGPFRVIVDGKEVTENILSYVIIGHKGYTVRVGSGFSIDERRHYAKNPKDLIGKTITVQYFEESTNQNGELSLRFPTVKYIHGEKREF